MNLMAFINGLQLLITLSLIFGDIINEHKLCLVLSIEIDFY